MDLVMEEKPSSSDSHLIGQISSTSNGNAIVSSTSNIPLTNHHLQQQQQQQLQQQQFASGLPTLLASHGLQISFGSSHLTSQSATSKYAQLLNVIEELGLTFDLLF